jgi:transcriptional regulator with XRE-family HTH domain
MERDWARLGRALAKAREAADLIQREVAARIGVSKTPIQAIERGTGFKTITGTVREYARLVGWAEGSVEAVLAGGEPTLVSEGFDRRPRLQELPLSVVDQLQGEGPLIAATVMSLPPKTAGASMTIVVQQVPDASPEQIRDALDAWRKTQHWLQNLHDGDEEAPSANEA